MTRPAVLIVLGLAVAAALVFAFMDLGSSGDPYDDGTSSTGLADETDLEGAALRGSAKEDVALTAESVEPGKESISGRVIDPDGKPVAGVDVSAHFTHPSWDDIERYASYYGAAARAERSRETVIAPRLDYRPENGRATTKDDGTFEITGLGRGSYVVRAHPAAPLVSSTASATMSTTWSQNAVVIRLLRGTPVQGKVIDGSDEPVDAVVSVAWSGTVKGTQLAWSSIPQKTGEGDGTFRFAAVPDGDVTFTVTIPGRLRISGLKATTPTDDDVVLRVPGGSGKLAGTVTDLEGEAIPGTQLTFTITLDDTRVTTTATTSARGTYAVEQLPTGELTMVEVLARGFAPLHESPPLAPWSGFEVSSEARELNFQLLRGGTLRGHVRSTKGNAPLAGATVHAFVASAALGYQGHMPMQTHTGPDGRFEITGVPAGRLVIIATHESHYMKSLYDGARGNPNEVAMVRPGRMYSPTPPAANTVLMPRNGATVSKDILLQPGHTIEGVVIDAQEQPVADAQVRVKNLALQQALQRWGVNWWAQVTDPVLTDGRGEFALSSLPAGKGWELFARKEGYAGNYGEAVDLVEGAETPKVTLKLSSGATVRGKVVDQDGAGVPGVNVNFYGNSTLLAGGRTQTTSGEDGSFEITGLPADSWQVWVQVMNGSSAGNHSVADLKEGEVREGIEIKVTAGGEKVTGRVLDPKGKPVRYLSLQMSIGNSWSHTQTNNEGRFTFNNVSRGTAKIFVHVSNQQKPLGESFEAPAEGLELEYEKPATHVIEGTVYDADGNIVPLCTLTIGGGRGNSAPTPWMPGGGGNEVVYGIFKRTVQGDGPWRLSVGNAKDGEGNSLNCAPFTMTIKEPPTKPLEIRLKKGKEITGVVTDSAGAGVAGVTVRAGGASASTDATGRFSLGGLGESATLQYQVPKGYVQPAQKRAKAGDHVELTLLTGLSVGGKVFTPEGAPAKSGWVNANWKKTARAPAGSAHSQVSGGKFSIEGIPEQALVTLSVSGPWENGTQKYGTVTVKDVRAGTTDVEVNFGESVQIKGKVLDTDGKAFTAGWIYARGSDGKFAGAMAQIQADGSFTIGGLVPGEYDVGVQKHTGGGAGESQKITAPATGIVIRMPVTVTIKGVLTGDDIAGYRVSAKRKDKDAPRSSFAASVMPNGSWEIPNVPEDGEWTITAMKRNSEFYAQVDGIRSGAKDVELRLRKGEEIAGRVTIGGASPEKRCWVMVSGEGYSSWSRSEADGTFTVKGLPPGRYKLSAMNPDNNKRGDPIDAETGQTGIVIDL